MEAAGAGRPPGRLHYVAAGDPASLRVVDVWESPQTFEAFGQILLFRAAFPDLEMSVDDMIVAGDMVADRVTWRATHRGELMGIPPTGRRVTVTEIHLARIADGKIVERWGNWDPLGLLRQLGAVPTPTRAGAESRRKVS